MKVSPDVLAAISERAVTDGPRLTLTGPRFTPRMYQQINEILEAVGGRWTSSEGAHLFPVDAADAIAPVLATGHVVTLREKRQEAQYFPTPQPVVERLLNLAQLQPGMRVLEPSAGSGALAAAAAARGATVDCIEQDPGYAATLTDTGCARTLTVADFLTVPPQPSYDRVVMNPPFTRGTDIAHVEHALRFLKPGGLLASVMSWAISEETRSTSKLRAIVEARGGTVEAVDAGAFRESGTDVPTVLVVIPAQRPADAQPVSWPARETPRQEEPAFGDPAEILAEIRSSLTEALAIFDDLAASLAAPTAKAEPSTAEVVELPERQQEQLQLGFDEAS